MNTPERACRVAEAGRLSPEGETVPRSALPKVLPATPVRAGPVEPSRTALILAFAAIYLIWGSTYLGIRLAIDSMPPFLMASARFIIAGSVLFAALKLRGASWPTAHQWIANAVIGTLLLLGGNGLVV